MKLKKLVFKGAFLFLTITFALLINNAFGQSQQGHLKGNWTEWQTVYTEQPNLKVEISFNFSPCDKYGNSNPSFWRIRSNFNRPKAHLTFSFNAIACGGLVSSTTVYFALDKPSITDDLGDHFRGYGIKGINLPAKMDDYGKSTSNTAAVSTPLNTQKQAISTTAANNKPSNTALDLSKAAPVNYAPAQSSGVQQLKNTQAYINRQTQQSTQIVQTLNEGLQNIGNILQQARERQANAENDLRAQARERQQEANDYNNILKASLLKHIGEGKTKDVVEYGILRLNDYNDGKTAHACFLAGAEVNDPKAMLWLALDYRNGIGGEKNDTLAAYWLKKAADHGSLTAMNRLAGYYSSGNMSTIPVNAEEALKWYSYIFFLTNNLSSADQVTMMNYFNYSGAGEIGDTEKSAFERWAGLQRYRDIYYFSGSTSDDNKFNIIRNITALYQKSGRASDIKEALIWQRYMQTISFKEIGQDKRKELFKEAEKKTKELKKLLKKAPAGSTEDSDPAPKLFSRAFAIYHSIGNTDSAKYYFTLAANKGDREAMFMLGNTYLNNERNLEQALTWYSKAEANEKTYMGVFASTYLYYMGYLAAKEKKLEQALSYYKKSTEFSGWGAVMSRGSLVTAYSTGYFGWEKRPADTPKDLTINEAEAKVWKDRIKAAENEEKILQYRK